MKVLNCSPAGLGFNSYCRVSNIIGVDRQGILPVAFVRQKKLLYVRARLGHQIPGMGIDGIERCQVMLFFQKIISHLIIVLSYVACRIVLCIILQLLIVRSMARVK